MNLDVAMDYLEFVAERHRIWERRQLGESSPWTDHPILAARKFTNVFRVLDYGSQFLLKELVCDDPRDQLMRFFLYRHTGRVETWEYLQLMMGDYPTVDTLDETFTHLRTYREQTRNPVFTNAYLVYPQSSTPGTDKLKSIFNLAHRLFHPDSATDIVPDFLTATSQDQRFKCLRRNTGVADFMSMQVLTDWGYTTEFREDDFVVCGPGAVKGAAEIAPGNVNTVHRWAVGAVRGLPDCPLLEGRQPSWMDIQNTLCEFSKFARYARASNDGVRYTPAHPGAQEKPTLPGKWT